MKKNNAYVVHLIPCEKFTAGIVNFINSNFETKYNIFILYGNNDMFFKKGDIEYQNNIIIFENINLIKFVRILLKSKKLIMHSMAFSRKILIILTMFIVFFKQTIWIPWGGDFYPLLNRRKGSDTNNDIVFFRLRVIRKIDIIAALTYGDYILIKDELGANGKYYPISYYDQVAIESLTKISNLCDKNHDEDIINIIVGNSAISTNNHVEILNNLSRFRNEKIKIYCPLSYGSEEYAKQITTIGKSLFGHKFIPILDYMEFDDYHSLLKSMNIAIYNNDRQQALGNIYANLALNTKVYMRNDTSMWKEIVEKNQFKVFTINNLSVCSFEGFVKYDDNIKERNKKLAYNYYSLDRNIEMWKSLLDMNLTCN